MCIHAYMITKQIEIGNIYASKQVWEMYNTNELQHLVDPILYGNFSENEAIRFLKVGLLCVQENPASDPACQW